ASSRPAAACCGARAPTSPPTRPRLGRSSGCLPAAGRNTPVNAVERLAERLGIEPAFRDAAGELRRTSPDVRLAILAAMGVAVASDDDARAALDALEREEWDVPFTPTVACAGPSGVCVDVALPAATGTVRW